MVTASLVLTAASVTLHYTLQALEQHFAWGCEEPSLQGTISLSRAEEMSLSKELELLWVLGGCCKDQEFTVGTSVVLILTCSS